MAADSDEDLERESTEVCREIGLPPSEAFAIFARAVIRERRLPFMPSAEGMKEHAVHAPELFISGGIARGIADLQGGDVISREKSRTMRAARRRDA
jgi:addiction module RelB/DinJ family antitoxin